MFNSLGPKLFFIARVVARCVECNNDNVTSGASPRYCVSAVYIVDVRVQSSRERACHGKNGPGNFGPA